MSEKEMTSEVFAKNTVPEFEEAMKQFQNLSCEVDQIKETNDDILRKINNRKQYTGLDEETTLSREEDSLQCLKNLEKRSNEKDEQVQILSATIETLSKTVDSLSDSLLKRQNIVQNDFESIEGADKIECEEANLKNEKIGKCKIDNVQEDHIVSRKGIENIKSKEVTEKKNTVQDMDSSSENTENLKYTGNEEIHGDIGRNKYSSARNSDNIKKNPSDFNRELTNQKDDKKEYNQENRIEVTRKMAQNITNTSQKLTKEERQSEATEQETTMRTKHEVENRIKLVSPSDRDRDAMDDSVWYQLLLDEINKAAVPKERRPKNPQNVLCLDISASMKGLPFEQMKELAQKIVNELWDLEYIALVTFGHETRVVKHMCNNYQDIRSCINKLYPDGPTPLVGGLLMALAGGIGKGASFSYPDINVNLCPRIILITDGNATFNLNPDGPDELPTPPFDCLLNMKLYDVARTLGQKGARIFCIPVGEANLTNIGIITSQSGGLIIHPVKLSYLLRMNANFDLAMKVKLHCKNTTVEDRDLQEILKKIAPSLINGITDEDIETISSFVENPCILGQQTEDQ